VTERLPLSLATACVVLAGVAARAEDIAFDAILYRARAGFDFCYSFEGSAGWSLRPIDARILHDGGAPCADGAKTPSQLAALADCLGGECHADCASFVRRAWGAGTNELLRPVETPAGGNCASPSAYGGDHYLSADADPEVVATKLLDARPGDWCSNPDHVLMIVARRGGGTWMTWEANSSAEGIGTRSVVLGPDWFGAMPRNDCGFASAEEAAKNSGCWHPPAIRTPAPKPLLPLDGAEVEADRLADTALRVQRPDHFPALGDLLLWLRWEGADGWEHRLVRLPAFSRRGGASRLVRFPGMTDPAGLPLDLGDVTTIEVDLETLGQALAAEPLDWKDPVSGAIAAAWTEGSALVPRPPQTFPNVRLDVGDELVTPREVTWRMRVERFGETSADLRTRWPVVPVCKADERGRETVDYCKDPEWSAERRFTLKPCVLPGCPRTRFVLGAFESLYGRTELWSAPHATFHGAGAFEVAVELDPPAPPDTPLVYDWRFSGDCDAEGPVHIVIDEVEVPLEVGGGFATWHGHSGVLAYRFDPWQPPGDVIPEMYDACTIHVAVGVEVGASVVPLPPVAPEATDLYVDGRPLYEVPARFVEAASGVNAVAGAYCVFDDLDAVDSYHTFPQFGWDDQLWIIRGDETHWGWANYLAEADVRAYFGGWQPFDMNETQAVWAWGHPSFGAEYLHPVPLFDARFPYDEAQYGALLRQAYDDARAGWEGFTCAFEPE